MDSTESQKFDIDVVCSMLVEGAKWKDIASIFSIPLSTLYDSITRSSEFSARVRESKDISADSYAEMAESVLQNAISDGVEIQRARELAQHYRWMAGKRSPKRYGESTKMEHSGEIKIENITGMVVK